MRLEDSFYLRLSLRIGLPVRSCNRGAGKSAAGRHVEQQLEQQPCLQPEQEQPDEPEQQYRFPLRPTGFCVFLGQNRSGWRFG